MLDGNRSPAKAGASGDSPCASVPEASDAPETPSSPVVVQATRVNAGRVTAASTARFHVRDFFRFTGSSDTVMPRSLASHRADGHTNPPGIQFQ
jgi:hypothetical protein